MSYITSPNELWTMYTPGKQIKHRILIYFHLSVNCHGAVGDTYDIDCIGTHL